MEMCVAQANDVAGTGQTLDRGKVLSIYRGKSGALYGCAAALGAMLGGADNHAPMLREYGENLGIAYQIVDDIADVMGDPQTLGKRTGMDERKTTLVSLEGVAAAQQVAEGYKERAIAALDQNFRFGTPTRTWYSLSSPEGKDFAS